MNIFVIEVKGPKYRTTPFLEPFFIAEAQAVLYKC